MNAITEAPSVSKTALQARASIEELEQALRAGVEAGEFISPRHDGGTDEGDAECQHAFGDGIYARGLLIPAGTAVVGRLHKQARVCIIAQGECLFRDENQELQVKAPWMGEFKAGCKTAVYAITDTYWVACLGTELKDSKQAFEQLTVATHEEYLRLA